MMKLLNRLKINIVNYLKPPYGKPREIDLRMVTELIATLESQTLNHLNTMGGKLSTSRVDYQYKVMVIDGRFLKEDIFMDKCLEFEAEKESNSIIEYSRITYNNLILISYIETYE